MGALTGGQALQQLRAAVQSIYLPGWQQMEIPPRLCIQISLCMHVIQHRPWCTILITAFAVPTRFNGPQAAGIKDYFARLSPADAGVGFGSVLNAFELVQQLLDAGAAGVHFEDQRASTKKCGHMEARC